VLQLDKWDYGKIDCTVTVWEGETEENYSAPGTNKWIDHVYPPTTQEEVIQFVRLWEALRGVVPNDMVEDDIRWKWTADGMYTTQSAYQAQFIGVFSRIKITPIWKAKAEHKCHFFLPGR
jgi:hypothetical protein